MGYELSGKRVWVAGHRGMVGSAIIRRLEWEGCALLFADRGAVDLRHQAAVEAWMAENRPQAIFLAAAKVGGIHANSTYPADFISDNLAIELNIIRAAYAERVEKLLFLGSSCIYPRDSSQPISEDALLSGPLEPTNEWYAVAKIAGIKLCQAYRRQYGCDFVSAMPTNLFGPGDNFHPEDSHVPAALLRRMHLARVQGVNEVEVWGTGRPKREFLWVDDLADACVFLMKNYFDESPINVGTGKDVTIRTFAELVAQTVGFAGRLVFDQSRPDGTPRKVLDVGRLNALGWAAPTSLNDALRHYYQWFQTHQDSLRQ